MIATRRRPVVGETYAEVLLKNNGKTVGARLLVDTGATYTWIHEHALRRLGVRPIRTQRFETIEGRLVKKSLGTVWIECLGQTAPTLVVFARAKDGEVLGLHALEGLALEVDPIHRTLRRLKAVKAF